MSADTAPQAPKSGRERRRWPRAKADWPISLELPEGRFEARVRDVSQAGVCCFLDRPLDLMTVLGIELQFPGPAGLVVSGRGIVVRSERISERLDHYEIAVFMPELSDADKAAIATYVEAHPELAAR
ncbi:MAG: PilZ domain-containing protein [Planctomycetes bacterium]|nr:PilZ domain-containing protein [Planctomycetota bacterium]